MDKKAVILNKADEIIVNARVESITENCAILRFHSAKIANEAALLKEIKFRLSDNYVENYKGVVKEVNENSLTLEELENITINYREDVKIDVDYKTVITFKDNGEFKRFGAQVLDISSSGICFCTKIDLDTSIFYETVVQITKEPIIMGFKIVRKLKQEDEIYIYGCKFLDVGQEEEKLLREAVFRMHQIKYRHK